MIGGSVWLNFEAYGLGMLERACGPVSGSQATGVPQTQGGWCYTLTRAYRHDNDPYVLQHRGGCKGVGVYMGDMGYGYT